MSQVAVTAVIARATFWALRDRRQHADYACIGPDNALPRFYLAGGYRARAVIARTIAPRTSPSTFSAASHFIDTSSAMARASRCRPVSRPMPR